LELPPFDRKDLYLTHREGPPINNAPVAKDDFDDIRKKTALKNIYETPLDV
jgi:hypothetical protein